MDLALNGHADAMNAFEQLEHPTQGRALSRLVDLVWYGLVLTYQLLTQSTLRHGIHEQCCGLTEFVADRRLIIWR